ncbi:MAG: Glycogen synthase [candidate division TA06 bacterium ADurb.Bin417]|uniref:Glycogen synthase n=1 Tax=candidate division TA06 bacterium ADurb.Bin417 TaxID=1852828 RepID=A0A1V5MEH8_UNCT6|nr:MAG: Glycogen synthase [candidate division TA06 bacterium ADurb.Bin417]
MKRIKIALVIATLEIGGAEKQLAELASRLDRTGFEPIVLCLRQTGPVAERLREAGVPVHYLDKRGKLDPGLIFRLAALLRRERPDILHSWMFTANTYGRLAAGLAGIPSIIAAERGADHWKRWYHFAIDRRLLKKTDRLLAVSEGVREFYARRLAISQERITVITNGVDLKRFRAFRPPRPIDPGLVLSAGRLAEQKGFLDLVRAARMVIDRKPGTRFTVLGEGPERPRLEAEIRRLGLERSFRLPGETADIRPCLFEAGLFVLPSLYEGMPNAVLEAMAAGKPVIATRVEGSREAVLDNRTGRLVTPAAPAELAAAILDLLADPARAAEWGEAGRRRVEAEYNLDSIIKEYESLYRELVKSKTTGPGKNALER